MSRKVRQDFAKLRKVLFNKSLRFSRSLREIIDKLHHFNQIFGFGIST